MHHQQEHDDHDHDHSVCDHDHSHPFNRHCHAHDALPPAERQARRNKGPRLRLAVKREVKPKLMLPTIPDLSMLTAKQVIIEKIPTIYEGLNLIKRKLPNQISHSLLPGSPHSKPTGSPFIVPFSPTIPSSRSVVSASPDEETFSEASAPESDPDTNLPPHHHLSTTEYSPSLSPSRTTLSPTTFMKSPNSSLADALGIHQSGPSAFSRKTVSIPLTQRSKATSLSSPVLLVVPARTVRSVTPTKRSAPTGSGVLQSSAPSSRTVSPAVSPRPRPRSPNIRPSVTPTPSTARSSAKTLTPVSSAKTTARTSPAHTASSSRTHSPPLLSLSSLSNSEPHASRSVSRSSPLGSPVRSAQPSPRLRSAATSARHSPLPQQQPAHISEQMSQAFIVATTNTVETQTSGKLTPSQPSSRRSSENTTVLVSSIVVPESVLSSGVTPTVSVTHSRADSPRSMSSETSLSEVRLQAMEDQANAALSFNEESVEKMLETLKSELDNGARSPFRSPRASPLPQSPLMQPTIPGDPRFSANLSVSLDVDERMRQMQAQLDEMANENARLRNEIVAQEAEVSHYAHKAEYFESLLRQDEHHLCRYDFPTVRAELLADLRSCDAVAQTDDVEDMASELFSETVHGLEKMLELQIAWSYT